MCPQGDNEYDLLLDEAIGKVQVPVSRDSRSPGCTGVYTITKVHDTRFVNHQRNGVRMLLHNWIPLMEAVENAVAHDKGKTHSARPAQLEGNVRHDVGNLLCRWLW